MLLELIDGKYERHHSRSCGTDHDEDSDVPRAYDFRGSNVTDDDDGYALYRQYAEDTGRADQWVEWSGQSCPQAELVTTNTPALGESRHGAISQVFNDHTRVWRYGYRLQRHRPEVWRLPGLRVCADETDYWAFTGTGQSR